MSWSNFCEKYEILMEWTWEALRAFLTREMSMLQPCLSSLGVCVIEHVDNNRIFLMFVWYVFMVQWRVWAIYKRFSHIYVSLHIHEFFLFKRLVFFLSSNWHTEEIISTKITGKSPIFSRYEREKHLYCYFICSNINV